LQNTYDDHRVTYKLLDDMTNSISSAQSMNSSKSSSSVASTV
jgi:hypothetical protein